MQEESAVRRQRGLTYSASLKVVFRLDVVNIDQETGNQIGQDAREEEVYLGDIIINLSQVKNKNNKVKFKEELNKLWIHGLLHLLGYDHKSDTKYLQMQKLENKFSYLIK